MRKPINNPTVNQNEDLTYIRLLQGGVKNDKRGKGVQNMQKNRQIKNLYQHLQIRKKNLDRYFVFSDGKIEKIRGLNERIIHLTAETFRNIKQIARDLRQKVGEGRKLYQNAYIQAFLCPVYPIIKTAMPSIAQTCLMEDVWKSMSAIPVYHMDLYSEEGFGDLEKLLTQDSKNHLLPESLREDFMDVPIQDLTYSLLYQNKIYARQDIVDMDLDNLDIRYEISF